MRIVMDTNIAFSAIMNTGSLIAKIILQPKSQLHFYSTDLLKEEIYNHREKIKRLTKYSDYELNNSISLITGKIRFIDADLIPLNVFINAEQLLKDIDIDDTEFVALTDHIYGKLWSGDKELQNGLKRKKWNKFISISELSAMISTK